MDSTSRQRYGSGLMSIPGRNSEPNDAIRVVTREEFNRIECNRCGVCCERIHMPSPLVLAQEIGRYALDRARWPREAIDAMGLEDAMLDRERLIEGPLTKLTDVEMQSVERSLMAVLGLL